MRIVHGLGRAIFGSFFLYNGINHLRHTEALEGYAAAKQVEYPHLSVKASGILMTAAGAGLILGLAPRLSALGVAGFLAAASAKMHDFWNAEDPGQRQNDMIHFSKNIALLGAALALMGLESKGVED
jgi:putative oxidoreductase